MNDALKIAIPTLVFIFLFAVGGYQAFGNYLVGAVIGTVVGVVSGVIVSARRQRRTHWSDDLVPDDDGE